MLMNKQGEKMSIDSREYYVGMAVICNEVTAYAGLRGHILELRDGDDRESENETVDIVCELYTPESADESREIEEKFSRLYGRAVTLDDIGLDYVIMAASMIELSDGANNLSGTNNDSAKANLPSEERISPFELTDGDKIIMAVVRLEYEANTSGGQNVPSIPIYNHLKKVCESDVTFSELVTQEHKTLMKCFSYVYEQVRSTVANGANSAWVADDIVYRLAEDYYRLDDAEIERQKAEEKKKRDEEIAKSKAEREKREAAKKTEINAKKHMTEGQITLGIDDDDSGDEIEDEVDGEETDGDAA